MSLTADDPRHGTNNGYGNLKCRCQPCRDAHAEYQRRIHRDWRERRRAQGVTARGTLRKVFDDHISLLPNEQRRRAL